jgi:hypothetical protein
MADRGFFEEQTSDAIDELGLISTTTQGFVSGVYASHLQGGYGCHQVLQNTSNSAAAVDQRNYADNDEEDEEEGAMMHHDDDGHNDDDVQQLEADMSESSDSCPISSRDDSHHYHYCDDYDHDSLPTATTMVTPPIEKANVDEGEVVVEAAMHVEEATATIVGREGVGFEEDDPTASISAAALRRQEPTSSSFDGVEAPLAINVVPTPAEGGKVGETESATAPLLVERKAPQRNAGATTPTSATIPTRTRVSWHDRMKQLADYKAEHGHLFIPIRFKPIPALGKFVHNTREQYKLYHRRLTAGGTGCGKKCSLTAERIEELQNLGFVWNTDRTQRETDEWMEKFTKLVRYEHNTLKEMMTCVCLFACRIYQTYISSLCAGLSWL